MIKSSRTLLVALIISISLIQSVYSQSLTELRFDIGSPSITNLYVDPTSGSDSSNGASPSTAFRSLTQAWNSIPQGSTLSTGYKINILPGTLSESAIPNYLESRHGTYEAPIIIQAVNGRGTVTLGGDLNIFDTRYLYLIDLVISPSPAGDALHCEQCNHLLIRNCELSGGNRQAHETVKINQSQYLFIEDSNIHGADDNAIDFVAVQYGHITRNRIHNAADWCAYAKGGSAYLRIESNDIYDCGTGGFTAGQGTGLEYMTSPWIHYEAYDLKIINNIIHNTEGAGLGVNGGYNILLAYNTLYRVGSRSHTLEVVFGNRSCDGSSTQCQNRLNLGGWGTATVGGDTYANIGNRNIYVYNNLIYNPSGSSSSQHFAIYGPRSSLSGSNVPGPVRTDVNLQIRGNFIYNAPGSASLGIDESSGCLDSNTTCNQTQLTTENTINSAEPQLIGASSEDYRPTSSSNLLSAQTFSIPLFSGGDRESSPLAPEGELSNSVTRDRSEASRPALAPPGAYASSDSSIDPPGGGGGSGGGSSDAKPTVSKASCTPKKAKIKQKITCTVVATDDVSLSKVEVVYGSTKKRLKLSSGKYKATIAFKKKGSYTLSALATDSASQSTSKRIGTFKIR